MSDVLLIPATSFCTDQAARASRMKLTCPEHIPAGATARFARVPRRNFNSPPRAMGGVTGRFRGDTACAAPDPQSTTRQCDSTVPVFHDTDPLQTGLPTTRFGCAENS